MDCDRVSTELVDAAVAASTPIERFYLAGGGSVSDLRTDLSYVVEAVLEALISSAPPPVPAPRRRVRAPGVAAGGGVSTGTYTGPDRRASRP